MTPRTDVENETKDHVAIIIGESPPSSSKFFTSPTGPSISRGQKEIELSSQEVQGEKEKSVFDRYREIKLKNQILKNNTYN